IRLPQAHECPHPWQILAKPGSNLNKFGYVCPHNLNCQVPDNSGCNLQPSAALAGAGRDEPGKAASLGVRFPVEGLAGLDVPSQCFAHRPRAFVRYWVDRQCARQGAAGPVDAAEQVKQRIDAVAELRASVLAQPLEQLDDKKVDLATGREM